MWCSWGFYNPLNTLPSTVCRRGASFSRCSPYLFPPSSKCKNIHQILLAGHILPILVFLGVFQPLKHAPVDHSSTRSLVLSVHTLSLPSLPRIKKCSPDLFGWARLTNRGVYGGLPTLRTRFCRRFIHAKPHSLGMPPISPPLPRSNGSHPGLFGHLTGLASMPPGVSKPSEHASVDEMSTQSLVPLVHPLSLPSFPKTKKCSSDFFGWVHDPCLNGYGGLIHSCIIPYLLIFQSVLM